MESSLSGLSYKARVPLFGEGEDKDGIIRRLQDELAYKNKAIVTLDAALERKIIEAASNAYLAEGYKKEVLDLKGRVLRLEECLLESCDYEHAATVARKSMLYYESRLGSIVTRASFGGSNKYRILFPGMHTMVGDCCPERFMFSIRFLCGIDMTWEDFLDTNPDYIRYGVEFVDNNLDTEGALYDDEDIAELAELAYNDRTALCPIPTGLAGVPIYMNRGENGLNTALGLRWTGDRYQVLVSKTDDQYCFPVSGRRDTIEDALYEYVMLGNEIESLHRYDERTPIDSLADSPANTDHAWYVHRNVDLILYTYASSESLTDSMEDLYWCDIDYKLLGVIPFEHEQLAKRFLNTEILASEHDRYQERLKALLAIEAESSIITDDDSSK